MHSFSDYDVTFEFDVKLKSDIDDCYDIFTYEIREERIVKLRACADVTHQLTNLQITYYSPSQEKDVDDTEFSFQLGYKLNLDTWYHLALVWQKNEAVLKVPKLTYNLTISSFHHIS